MRWRAEWRGDHDFLKVFSCSPPTVPESAAGLNLLCHFVGWLTNGTKRLDFPTNGGHQTKAISVRPAKNLLVMVVSLVVFRNLKKECKLHAPYPASSWQIGAIHSGARRKSWMISRRLSACGSAHPPKNTKNFSKSLSEQIATPVNNEEM